MKTPPIPPQPGSVYSDPALSDFAKWLDEHQRHDEAEVAPSRRPVGSWPGEQLTGPVGGTQHLRAARARTIFYAPVSSGAASDLFRAGDRQQGVHRMQRQSSRQRRIFPSAFRSVSSAMAGAPTKPSRGRSSKATARASPRCSGNRRHVGPLLLTQAASTAEVERNPRALYLNWLLEGVSTSINTAAAGGNAEPPHVDRDLPGLQSSRDVAWRD